MRKCDRHGDKHSPVWQLNSPATTKSILLEKETRVICYPIEISLNIICWQFLFTFLTAIVLLLELDKRVSRKPKTTDLLSVERLIEKLYKKLKDAMLVLNI